MPQLQTPVQFESLESREVRLTAGEIQGLVDPGIRSALADLAQRADKELDRVRVIAAQNVTWPDASLGCPEPGFSYAQALTEGIQLLLLYETEKFDYRITGVYSRLCENAQPGQALESRPLLGIWSRLADMPTPRSEVAAATVGGKIYVMGGFGAGATAHEEYDPVTDTWRKRAPIPRGVDHPAAVGLNGHVFLIGGLDGRWGPVDNVLAYDPAEDRWTAKAPLPTARGALGAAVRGGHILAFGGIGVTGDVGTTEHYDPETDTWSERSSMPTARDHIAVAAVEGNIYVLGGRLGSYARNLGTNEKYDPEADIWAARAPLPTTRSGIGAAAVQGKLYLFGGESTDGTIEENEVYDPATDRWEPAPPMPTARHGIGVVSLGNRIYVLAGGLSPGGSSSALNEVFIVLERSMP